MCNTSSNFLRSIEPTPNILRCSLSSFLHGFNLLYFHSLSKKYFFFIIPFQATTFDSSIQFLLCLTQYREAEKKYRKKKVFFLHLSGFFCMVPRVGLLLFFVQYFFSCLILFNVDFNFISSKKTEDSKCRKPYQKRATKKSEWTNNNFIFCLKNHALNTRHLHRLSTFFDTWRFCFKF